MLSKFKYYLLTHKLEIIFLFFIYLAGVYFRLAPRLAIDPHLLTLNADIWERLSLAQYFLDHRRLPQFCLRYIAYGEVPLWYPPISPIFFASLSLLFHIDIPTVSSRIIPFIEALTPTSIFFLGKYLFNKRAGYLATIFLSLTPSFLYWSGISDPQSLTLFLLPIYIMLLIWRKNRENLTPKQRWIWVLGLSILLAINFLTHLSYFLAVLILLLVFLALSIGRAFARDFAVDFLAAIVFSQIFTIWWWAPRHLYWWWINALTTSSGIYTPLGHLREYGSLMGILGISAAIFLIIILFFDRRRKQGYVLVLFFWSLLPFLETQNETILVLIKRPELAWLTLVKPLEGFRFYCFLAQPLALISALVCSEYIFPYFKRSAKALRFFALLAMIVVLILDIYISFGWNTKIRNAGITAEEYQAAVWFRNNSKNSDRIIADYYRVQMFAGVCGGKSLLGGLFPLRNVDFPYIKVPAQVQDDIYRIYSTANAQETCNLMKRYNCTHILYSNTLIEYGGFGSKFNTGFGVDINKDKFADKRFFEEVYNFNNDIIIIERKD